MLEPKPKAEPISSYADFVDPKKDPIYYVERYYSEPTYKSWFDRNYPGQTIENAVGYTGNTKNIKSKVQEIIEKEIIPQAQASTLVESGEKLDNSSDIAQISLAVASLGILFGAVYGVKRQVDNNSKQILINKDTIRKKFIHPFLGSSPLEIIEIRLAKGEITLDEFELLKAKLD
ncbi:MAG: SHOCT domain-containing protein [Nitrosopumilus sp.]|nr:SHOCT domain-containing protein [Nitrosopumilus sp.]